MNERLDTMSTEELQVPEKMNIFQRLANLFFSPKKLFAYIRNKPTILYPIILMSIGSILAQLLLWDQSRDLQLDLMYNTYKNMGMNTSPESLESLVNINMYSTLAMAPIMILVTWLFTTLILYLVFRLIGCEKGLKKYFSMIGYIGILSVIGQVIHSAFLYWTHGDLMSPAVTSLASLLGSDMQGTFLYGLASGIEVFNIWAFILYAIGFIYTGSVNKKKSCITTVILFIVVLLLTAGINMASSQLMGGYFGSLVGQ